MKSILAVVVAILLAGIVNAAEPVMTVTPLADGAVATVNVGEAIDAGGGTILGTLKAVAMAPVKMAQEYPKLSTAAVLAMAGMIVRNNPRLIGLDKRDEDPAAAPGNSENTTTVHDQSVSVNLTGNSGSQITVVIQSPELQAE